MKKGQKLFVVDLKTVSLFNELYLNKIAQDVKYEKTPFLFLIASYVRNQSMTIVSHELKYENKLENGDWVVYSFVRE